MGESQCPFCGHIVTGFEQQEFEAKRAEHEALHAEIGSLRSALAKCREETVEHQFAVKYAWLRSEAILRGAFKSGIHIDAEYDRALASTGEGEGDG